MALEQIQAVENSDAKFISWQLVCAWVGPFDKGAPRRDPSLENYPHADDVRSGLHVRRWIVISQSFLGFS